jgi:hypothetical protein
VNREATADALGSHERASATPTAPGEHEGHTHHGRLGAAPAWSLGKLTLRDQQRWFAAIVSTPQTEPAPVDEDSARRLIKPSSTLSAAARIDIYRRGYHARLIECLIDDYPVLQHALGEDAFEALCRAYIAAHPSSAPSLNYFGRHMSELCRSQPLPAPGFAADLATLEWAIVLCIHAPTASVIDLADVSKVPPERWPGARFTLNPTLRILHLAYPANSYLQDYRQRRSPTVSGPRSTVVAVYRTGRSVWRLELEPTLVTLLESLRGGATLEAALGEVQALLSEQNEAEAAKSIAYCFQHSVSSGLFSGFTL